MLADETQFDVVVIGAGPAGSAAAFTSASQGLSTCVLDRSHFPRDKLCGGLLTLRSRKIFERVFQACWDPVIEGNFAGISVFCRGDVLANVRNYSSLFATQRYNFDNFLLRLAEKEGAVLRLGQAAKQFDFAANKVTLADGSIIKFAHLIGADGVNSTVARSLFGKPFLAKTIGVGMEINVARVQLPRFPEYPEIHLGAARWGYGWVFPKAGHAVVGVGGLQRKNPDLKRRLHEFLLQRCGTIPPGAIRGHFLPFGAFRTVPGRGNVLLVGDAAGLVDSMSGEGIAFAMQSGNAAAQSVVDGTRGSSRDGVLDDYRRRYAQITRLIGLSNTYRPLVFLPIFERLFARTLVGADEIQRAYLDIFADQRDYGEMPTLIARQLREGAVNWLRALRASHRTEL